MDSQVLVIPTKAFNAIGHFEGFNPNSRPYMDMLSEGAELSFILESQAETDPEFKQIVSYALFERTDPATGDVQLFHYTRGPDYPTQRSQSPLSLGVGGKIRREPVKEMFSPSEAFEQGLKREVDKEVRFTSETPIIPQVVGLINDDLSAAGRVRLGVVLIYHLRESTILVRPPSPQAVGFSTIALLYQQYPLLEPWSQLCLKRLYPAAEYFSLANYIGMPHGDATSLAASMGVPCRITKEEGQAVNVSMEFQPKRINFETKDGKVVTVTRG